MTQIDVVDLQGKRVGDIELDDSIFGVQVKEHILWEAVKMQLAGRRAGTHSTLRRDEVRGGGKKPYRQKGTGRARQGSSRAPNHVGGGKVFSPKPREYSYTFPKKAWQTALRSALSLRAREQKLIIVDLLEIPEAKTKHIARCLGLLGASSALIIDKMDNISLARAARNLPTAQFLAQEGLNVYDILNHDSLILSRAVVPAIEARLRVKR